MNLRPTCSDDDFTKWLGASPSEDELREAYLMLETRRAALWTPGHIDSFHRDRFERDATYVARLVRVKRALARHWETTGQFEQVPA